MHLLKELGLIHLVLKYLLFFTFYNGTMENKYFTHSSIKKYNQTNCVLYFSACFPFKQLSTVSGEDRYFTLTSKSTITYINCTIYFSACFPSKWRIFSQPGKIRTGKNTKSLFFLLSHFYFQELDNLGCMALQSSWTTSESSLRTL